MVKTVLSLFIGVLMLGTLASCMEDPITTNEAIPQNIYRPNSVGFRFINYVPGAPTGSIRVYWSNSSSDVQPNFGGYVARILTFDSVLRNGAWIQQGTVFAEKIVSKTTFEAIFDNVPIDSEYVFAVWGMRNPDSLKLDSLILSRDSAASYTNPQTNKRVTFNPRPLKNPTVIRAASVDPTSVLLNWDVPSTHTQGNILSYAVYYRDPSKLNDSAKYLASIPYLPLDSISKNINTVRVTVTGTSTGAGVLAEKELEYWVKVIRTDSTQFYDDSTLIRWSGGERLSIGSDSISSAIHLGKALTIGRNLQGRFAAEEREPDNALSWIKFDDAGDNILLTGLNGTKFYATYHEEESLDVAKFTKPLDESEFDQTTLSIPKATAKGWNVYARLFGSKDEPLRLHLGIAGSTIINANNAVPVTMIYQPVRNEGVPPYPYF
jgi:hypothetical protein